jgi:hypothetical protein
VFGPIYWVGLGALFLSSLRLVSGWFTRRHSDGGEESDNTR